ncbi:MAG: T9SS type A sorting domain-containing protein [Bacteroidota bacterium]
MNSMKNLTSLLALMVLLLCQVAAQTEAEPNNTFAQANSFNEGSTVTATLNPGMGDQFDFFQSVPNDDGTLIIRFFYTNGAANNSIFVNAFAKNGGGIGSRTITNTLSGVDSIVVACQQQDTFYLRFTCTGTSSYQFSYRTVSTGVSDMEPNDTRQTAQLIGVNDTVDGRLGYRSAVIDANDYFALVTPSTGSVEVILDYTNTSGAVGSSFIVQFSTEAGSTLGSINRTSLAPTTFRDTLSIGCLNQDTFLIRVTNAGACYSYQMHFVFTPTLPDDPEPNNSNAEAFPISFPTRLQGNINFRGTPSDQFDFYRIDNEGLATFEIEAIVENPGLLALVNFRVQIFPAGGGGAIRTLGINGIPTGVTRDTLLITCLPKDSLLLRLDASACLTYDLRIRRISEALDPVIETARFGNQFAFSPQVRNTASIFWDFGNGDRSRMRFPTRTFVPGVYNIQLQATNARCGVIETARDTFIIEGIERYWPLEAGTDDGFGFFVLRIFGGGLDANATVTLTQGSTVLRPFRVATQGLQELGCAFNLRNVPLGLYDVDITLSNGQTYSFPDGFTIYADTDDFGLYTRLKGPGRARTGQFTPMSVEVINEKGFMASGVHLFIVVPRGIETDLLNIMRDRTGDLLLKGNVWDSLEIDRTDFSNTYFQGNFDPNVDTLLVQYDSLYQVGDSLFSFEIDQLYDSPLEARVYPIYIPFVNAHSTYTVNFQVRSPVSTKFDIRSYVWPFTLRKNPPTAAQLDFVHSAGMNGAALAELSPNPALKAVGKSAGYVDVGSKVLFAEFFDWCYGTNVADAQFYKEQGFAGVAEVAGSFAPLKGEANFRSATRRAQTARNQLKDATEYKRVLEETILSGGKLSPNMADRLRKELNINKELIDNLTNLSDQQKQQAINAVRHLAEKNGLSFTNNQLSQLLFPKGQKVKDSRPKDIDRRALEALTSFDPNAIYGNEGIGLERYIRGNEQLNYMITFENADTAAAPAGIVRVVDTLNPAVFDLQATFLGNITLGDSVYQFEPDRQSFFREIDLRPAQDLIVRVMGNIDTTTGVMVWEFISLDPATMELPLDPLIGFLPPNVNAPEGEGSVSFYTRLRSDVAHLDTASTFALIFFDANDPIKTNIWKHTVDMEAAMGSIDPNFVVNDDTTFTITLNGNDTHSGLESFLLNIKPGSGVWNEVRFEGKDGLELEINAEIGETFQMYVLAGDSVGNVSDSMGATLIQFTLTDLPEKDGQLSYLQIGPNPCREVLKVFTLGFYLEQIQLIDMNGRVVQTQACEPVETHTVNVGHLPQGMYLLQGSTRAGKSISTRFFKTE